LIRRGYEAADAQRENFIKLKELLDSFGAVPADSRNLRKAESIMTKMITLDSVAVEGATAAEQRWLLRRMGIKSGGEYCGKKLQEAAESLMGIGIFSNVAYDTTPCEENGHYKVSYRLERSKSHYLKLGLRFDTNEAVAALLNFGWNENKLQGFRFGLNAKLSYNPNITVYGAYCAPALIRINLDYNYRKSEYSILAYGEEHGTRKYNRQILRLYLSQFRTSPVGFKLGLAGEYSVNKTNYNLEHPIGLITLPSSHFAYANAFGEFGVNNLDTEYFSTKGIKADLKTDWFFSDFGACKRYNIPYSFLGFGSSRLRFLSYIPVSQGRFVISPQVYARVLYGPSIPLEGGYDALHWSYFGGDMAGRYFEDQLPFIGTNFVSSAYDNVAIARVDLRYNIAGPHYVSLLANALYSCEFSENNNNDYLDMMQLGAALRYSLDTSFGPISLDFQWTDKPQFSFLTGKSTRFSLYLSAGFNF